MFNKEGNKNPGLAAILSFVFNGLGQIYNGQLKKGLVIMFLSALSMLTFILGSILIAYWLLDRYIFNNEFIIGVTLFVTGLLFICIIGIYNIFDAYRVASKK